MKKIICQTCNQDMNEPPHKGLLGRDCPQCGQGIMWRFARKVERANKACTGRACLCGKEDDPIGESHSAFCPAYEPARQ